MKVEKIIIICDDDSRDALEIVRDFLKEKAKTGKLI